MDRPGGKYEVSVFDPQLDHRETESRGSMFAFGAEGTKSLFMSPGSYMFAFKYADTGVCGYASRKIDVPVQREIRLSEDDVEFETYLQRTCSLERLQILYHTDRCQRYEIQYCLRGRLTMMDR